MPLGLQIFLLFILFMDIAMFLDGNSQYGWKFGLAFATMPWMVIGALVLWFLLIEWMRP